MTVTPITTAQDLIDALLQIREERNELDAREAFIKEQLQGALALGELDQHETEDGIYQFSNAKYSRVERSSFKLSKEAEAAIRTIKERDIDSGLAERKLTIFYRLDSMI
jgi:DNA repair exonuclease SbcCD nuclease subunit